MKNLFKSMMLVAVAAMGMVACQNEPETVIPGNENLEKATIEVIADLETTRSAFGDKDGNFYPSYWQGGEQVEAAYLETGLYGGSYVNVISSDVATVTATGSVAKFGLTFSSLPSTSGTLLIASPAESVDFEGSAYYYDGDMPGFVVKVPTEQTPLEGSVDPKAHILTATYTGSFASAIKPDWEHAAAYGKMTLKNFDKEIDNVVVTVDTKSYILSATNVVNNVFWFGCEANEAPTTVKVVVNTPDEKAYTKTLDLSKGNGQGLPFVKGQVAEFGVNMDGVEASTGEEFSAQYMATDLYWDSTNSCFVFVVDAYDTFWVKLNEADRPGNNTILSGNYVGINSGTVPQGKFSVTQKTVGGWKEGWTSTKTTSTMSVAYVNGEYQILVNYVGAWGGDGQVGYKGVPDGWVVPGGSEEPEPDPSLSKLDSPTNLEATDVTADSITVRWDVVVNASGYAVAINGGTAVSVDETTYTFTGLSSGDEYEITVVAKGDGSTYADSDAAVVSVTTEGASSADGSYAKPYTFTNATLSMWAVSFTGAENGAELAIGLAQGYTLPSEFSYLNKSSYWMHSYGDTVYKINGTSYTITYPNSYADIELVSTGVWKVNLLAIVSGGSTIFYKYDGTISK